MRSTWVTARLGIELRTTDAPLGVGVADLVGLAVRRNPKRVQLLVSEVLGKHVPTDPRVVYSAGRLLGLRVAELLGAVPAGTVAGLGPALSEALTGGSAAALRDAVCSAPVALPGRPIVLGNAETATGLGHAVADALGTADYLQSTRRPVAGLAPLGGYDEPHSHAAEHLLQPASPEFFDRPDVLVLVDDELSTGVTALNTIAELHRRWPRDRYVIASLVDVRSEESATRVAKAAAELGTQIDVVSLVRGEVVVPEGCGAAAEALLAELDQQNPAVAARPDAAGAPERVPLNWPVAMAESGRHGFTPHDRARLETAVAAAAAQLAPRVHGRVLVLGTEEFMYLPLRLAEALADRGADVRYSTTTRSPVLAVDEDGYAIRTALAFDAHDEPADGPGPRFAYNVRGADTVVVVTDAPADTPALESGLLARVSAVAGRVLLVSVPVPPPLPQPRYGPGFGSYDADEVAWLLKDLSDVELEAPTEEREEAIQAGGAHYAESLPIEYQPSPEYQKLFHTALAETATKLAYATGVVTELVMRARGSDAVLVSLARAGVPVGILMKRWAEYAHDLDVPHYAVSIVRGRGIDKVALRYLAAHHDPSRIMFVDGWTGKGAITRELVAAVEEANAAMGTAFSPEMAVLADPGRCVTVFGTREDYLIPSACLNSTVSGLVSRTVLKDGLIGPGDFHGAKFYSHLADADVSNLFLDAVAARFPAVAEDVARDWPALEAADRTPDWAGWAAVERICDEYGIGQPNLVKPGVGETTRVLLRRVPWRILARPGADLAHIRLLAAERDVPVEEVDGLPYACVGLIHPNFTRGATGADGTTVGGQ